MNLAILHYHLNRGGVTRVIENQLAALDAVLRPGERWRVALLFGGRRNDWPEDLPEKLQVIRLSLHEVPELDYDDQCEQSRAGGPDKLAGRLAELFARIGFTPQETVLHVHNHSLGKNVSLPASLARLAGRGYPLLLQIHDFAEDFRPANYRRIRDAGVAGALYPQAPHIHYAVLNGRDYEILQAAGVDVGRLYRLPNPVPEMDHLPPRPEARRLLADRFGIGEQEQFVLYPVRCIRRKNVGEALLYSALAPPGTVVGLTLPPLNPAELPIYQSWKQLAAELDLPVCFELGAPGGLSFAENLAAADLILTTSLAEGFGMVFLESWLAGRPLLGRDLPEVTRDFIKMGLKLDWLRPQLDIPLDWVGADTFRQNLLAAYRRTLEAYDREEPKDLVEQLDAKINEGKVDFGDLDETLQQQVLRTVCGSEKNRRRALQCNPWIERSLSVRRDEVCELITENARAIGQHFSHQPSGQRLLQTYRQVAASPHDGQPQPLPHAERILDRFVNPTRFRPLRGQSFVSR